MGKRKTLGRGLGAILDEVEEAYSNESNINTERVVSLDVSIIEPNPYQPRKHFDEDALEDLSESLKRHGLLQPIVVIKKGDGYQLIAGERRLRATKLAGFNEIKAIIADPELSQLRELALIENIQRENLNPIELAHSYKELINENKITQEDLAGIIHKSRAQITNTLRLLNLSIKTQTLLVEGKISQGHAKVLVGLEEDTETKIVNTILGNRLNVRETEKLIKTIKNTNASEKDLKDVVEELTSLKYIIKSLKNRGYNVRSKNKTLVLTFNNDAEASKFYKIIE